MKNNSTPYPLEKKIISILPPAIFVLTNIFIFGPANIYRGNNTEFSAGFLNILAYYIIPFFSILTILTLLAIFLKKRYLLLFTTFVFVIGILLWIQGNLLVWNYGVLDGKQIDWQRYSLRGWIDIGLWVILICCFSIFYKKISKLSSTASIAMIFLQSFLFIITISINPSILMQNAKRDLAFSEDLNTYSSSENIIHIILDGMQTDVFQEVIEEDGLSAEFDGFVLYRDNISAYGTTGFSVPSIFSGELKKESENASSYIAETFKKKSFTNKLYEFGYRINIVPWTNLPFDTATNYYVVPRGYGSIKSKNLGEAALLLDLTLFRHFPHFIKKRIYKDQKWTFYRLVSSNENLGYFYFKYFLKDYISSIKAINTSPTYHFVHIMPPHEPFVTCEDCSYSDSILAPTRNNYKIEVKCILRLVCEYLEKLKGVGIYDSSFILLHADHGAGFPLKIHSDARDSSDIFLNNAGRSLALLAIKKRDDRGKLRTSDIQTSLLDIPKIIIGAARLDYLYVGNSDSFFEDNKETRKRIFANKYIIQGSVYDAKSWKEKIKKTSFKKNYNTYKWDEQIIFGLMGNAKEYKQIGWSFPDDGFTWSEGNMAEIVVPVEKTHAAILLKTKISAFLGYGKLKMQDVGIFVNDQQIDKWMINKEGFHEKKMIIPVSLLESTRSLRIKFELPNATSPYQLGIGLDKRKLAIAIKSITMEELMVYNWGSIVYFDKSGIAQKYQHTGWSNPEDGFTWTDGKIAQIKLPINDMPKSTMVLTAILRPFLGRKRQNQIISIMVNGKQAGQWKISSDDFTQLKLVLPKDLFTEKEFVRLTFNIPYASSPKDEGINDDNRILGAAFRSLNISYRQ